MPNYRAQVIFQGRTGIPEDRFVNTYHFSGVGTISTDGATIQNRLQALYTTDGGTPSHSIVEGMSPFCDNTMEIRIYDLADAEPRVPLVEEIAVTHGTVGAVQLPEEVAICVSFMAAPPRTPRRRGRVFLGPLTSAWQNAPGATATPLRVTAASQARLRDLFVTHMLEPSNTTALKWVIRSPSSGLFPIVVDGFVDDAFDVIRGRGPDPTARTEFVV